MAELEACRFAAVVTLAVSVVKGVESALKVTVDEVEPLVIEPPPVIDQAYVAPGCTGTLALRPVVPLVVPEVESVMAAFAGLAMQVEPES